MVQPRPVAAYDFETLERCPRKLAWERQYPGGRVKPLECLYVGLEAGLKGKDPRNAIMTLAASPGLDVEGVETYSLAHHYAKLAEILTLYLLGKDKKWERNGQVWESGGDIRRVVLVDRWSEQRKMEEIRSWRTVAEVCRHDRPMLLNMIVIGSTVDQKRVSPWTRGYSHPKNGGLRFKKKDGESLGAGWEQVWRERWTGDVNRWLGVMQRDKIFDDLVHTVRLSVPHRRDEFMADMERMEQMMRELPANPPMNRGGCYRFSPCGFVGVCHAPERKTPAECGWVSLDAVRNAPLVRSDCVTVG